MTDVPLYLDRAGLRRELGVTAVTAERIFRALANYTDGGKVYVRGPEAVEWMEAKRQEKVAPA